MPTATLSFVRTMPFKAKVAEIPWSHLDLIDGPYWTALTTVMPERREAQYGPSLPSFASSEPAISATSRSPEFTKGKGPGDARPQTTPVWCNREGSYVLTNTMRGFQKEKNMRANPRVTLFVYDPRNPLRNIEVRGLVVEMTEVGAIEHDDELARLYLGKEDAHFFGDAVPARLLETYCPVKVAIAPFHVRVEEPGSTLPRSLQLEPPHIQAGFRPSPLTITPAPPGNQPVPIPASHQDLLVGRVHGVLSTMLPGGQPQSSLVWVDYEWSEGQPPRVLINTALERQKCRNMLANPRVTVLVVDPANTERWVEVRGRVTRITSEGATAHADKLTQRYAGKTHFYGDIYPVERRQSETRVIVEIEPDKITLDAIFR